MSKTPEAKTAYAVRRELRIARLRAATHLLPYFLAHAGSTTLRECVVKAVEAADRAGVLSSRAGWRPGRSRIIRSACSRI